MYRVIRETEAILDRIGSGRRVRLAFFPGVHGL